MSDLRDFLNWFGGYCENIEEAPTAKQWGRIKAKIDAIQAVSDAVVVAPRVPLIQTAPEAPSKPVNETMWISQYMSALVDGGADMQTAQEMGGQMMGAVDLASSPQSAAANAIKTLFN